MPLLVKLQGVQVRSQASMALGRDAAIRIRGAGSLQDKQPLYVIDGTPTQSNDINLDDVESISVLKGPSATALYGQRGDAGVVVITTKKGEKRKGLGIEVNQSFFVDRMYILPEYQNEYAGGGESELIQFAWQNGMPEEWKVLDGKFYHDYSDDASWGPRLDGQQYIPWYAWYPDSPYFGKTEPLVANPDNIRDFYETGSTSNTNVNLSQAGEGYSTRFSMTNQNVQGLIPNTSLNKYILSTQSSVDVGKYFTAGANITFTTQETNAENADNYATASSGNFNQWFHRHLDMNKIRELSGLRSPEGYLASWNHNNPSAYLTSPRNFYAGNYWYNQFDYFNNTQYVNERERLVGDLNLTFKLNDNFKIAGYLRRNQVNTNWNNKRFYDLETGGTQTGEFNRIEIGQTKAIEDNYEILATYFDRFGDLSVEANAGGNVRSESFSQNSGNSNNGLVVPDLFTMANSRNPASFNDFRSGKKVNSLYSLGSFGYKETVYLEWSARNDWSSALPKDANSYFYPSFGASFVFSELTANILPILSYGKLRGSWAQVGSDLPAYQLDLAYTLQAQQFSGNPLMATPNLLIDPNIRPSLSSAYEGGLDLRFFQNKLGLSFTYFKEDKEDEIVDVAVTPASGFTTKKVNAGKISRDGIELALDATPVSAGSFEWNIGVNFSKVNSEIIELAPGVNAIVQEGGTFGTTSGVQLVHAAGERWGQLRGGAYKMVNGQRVVDANGRYVAEPNSYLGSVLPDWTGGMFNSLTYKNFVFNFNVDFQKGGNYFSLSDHWGVFSGLMARTAGLNDKGNPVRDAVADGGGVHIVAVTAEGTPVDRYVDAFTYFHDFRSRRIAEEHVYDLSFIKLREVSLGYRIPVNKVNALNKWLQNATISIVARNPWLVYAKNRDFDPSEISNSYGENGQYPGSRSIGFNLKLGF
ncbi:MAG: SusC/RagA family TonB-linked outer membrane protein [Saprospiraceae bacterium]|nr:SusC/RagA family TonB-linked outer membrane protein [Saprospiraceae bacterium]